MQRTLVALHQPRRVHDFVVFERREARREKPAVVDSRGPRLSALEEPPSVSMEHRCKRFDVGKPLASRLSELEETLPAFEEHRCERFDVVNPLAARLSWLEETLPVFEEHRCERFDVVNPLASRLSE